MSLSRMETKGAVVNSDVWKLAQAYVRAFLYLRKHEKELPFWFVQGMRTRMKMEAS